MFLGQPPSSDGADAMFADELASNGYIANFMRVWAWRPDVFASYVSARGGLVEAGSLSERDLAVLVTSTRVATRRLVLLTRLGDAALEADRRAHGRRRDQRRDA